MGTKKQIISNSTPNVFLSVGVGLTIKETVQLLAERGIHTSEDTVRTKLANNRGKFEMRAIGYRATPKGVPAKVYDDSFFEGLSDTFQRKTQSLTAMPAPTPVRTDDAIAAMQLLGEQIFKLTEAVEENTRAVNRLQGDLYNSDLRNNLTRMNNLISEHLNKRLQGLQETINSLSLRAKGGAA